MSETIRVKPYGGRWQVIGPGGDFGGTTISDSEAKANEWGPDTLSFTLKVPPGKIRPDLSPYNPVEYLVDGKLVWAGYVLAPLDDEGLRVDCRGWQYHLDDDNYNRIYVHNRLADWQDARAHPGTQTYRDNYAGAGTTRQSGLRQGIGEGEVGTAPAGGVYMIWPTDTFLYANGRVGVILDLGPDQSAKRVVITYASSNTTANISLYVRGTTTAVFGSSEAGALDAITVVNNAGGGPTTTAGTFSTERRYLQIFMRQNNVSGYYTAADVWFYLSSVKVFYLTAYESGNASILKADQVVKDARNTAAPLLNQSDALISAGTYSLPAYQTGGFATARKIIEQVNRYENYETKIGGADLMSVVYRAKPTAPLFEVGAWSGDADLEDAGMSGDDIFSKVIIEATDPTGLPVHVTRTQTAPLLHNRVRSSVLSVGDSGLATADANQLGDLWLAEHRYAPFAGELRLSEKSVRWVRGGAPVALSDFLCYTGEKIRFSHRIDPNTGGHGRDGRIASVTYRHSEGTCEMQIDDRRDDFATALARQGE